MCMEIIKLARDAQQRLRAMGPMGGSDEAAISRSIALKAEGSMYPFKVQSLRRKRVGSWTGVRIREINGRSRRCSSSSLHHPSSPSASYLSCYGSFRDHSPHFRLHLDFNYFQPRLNHAIFRLSLRLHCLRGVSRRWLRIRRSPPSCCSWTAEQDCDRAPGRRTGD